MVTGVAFAEEEAGQLRVARPIAKIVIALKITVFFPTVLVAELASALQQLFFVAVIL